MPEPSGAPIGGSVIERSFIANDIATVVFAATAPVAEIAPFADHDSPAFLRNTLASLVGIPPRTIIDERQYADIARTFVGALPFGPIISPFWDTRLFRTQRASMMSEIEAADAPRIRSFAEHALALFSSTARADYAPMGWGIVPPGAVVRDILASDLDEDAARCGIACALARLYRERKVETFTKGLLSYELPLGQSPARTSDSLLKLLESGKKMCLAPLAAGGAIRVGQLNQAQYVAALLSVATGSAMTLILLGSVAVGALLVARVAQQRNDGNTRSRSHRRK